ncbi:nadh-ubiquinone oxidoreductase 78 kda mitochondrial [Fusarium heterosporum]|uniref:NADH-ubiquinone oxidoreductase 78 kDa subunit, mitochondrial n=1 Tax=Fusarium heterosporum TaxID=42747 RepID=A0A8H5TIX0_FUSHE|nr:nadh-ubiquinone oxidoreductase 78 kda mitochondrial [Fusarium heterosporum]
MLRSTLARSAWRTSRRAVNVSRTFATTSQRPAEVELTIDGKKVSIEAGSALIQACEKAGSTVPRYCYHEKLMIAGNCRMCLVEVERAPKPVASCAWPVQPGMVVKTNSPLTHKAREGVMEFLLANHPLDCPVCDQGGECDLQDQSMRYGADRGRFHEIGGKRAVEDKNIGPLIKTSMNRCIHCTRCIRFSNDIAGAPEMGSTGRGNDIQIGTYLEQNLDSEMSGNVIDLCPVGALTSKPYAFRARPWELKHTESIDVLDGLGSNIRVDSRGLEVMRILPRLNDDVNEEWINDKTRFACDGLKTQRLTMPLVRREGRFEPAEWEEALSEIGRAYQIKNPQGNEFKIIAGALTEVESLVVAKDMANKLGSENLALDTPTGSQPLAHGVDVRSNFLFNSQIWGIEEADAILIVGSNPRHEAAVLNARIRKQWLRSDLEIGVVGETWDSTFEFEHFGTDHAALKSALSGPFAETLKNAKRPMIIVGSGVTDHVDAKAYYETIGAFVEKHASNFRTEEWQGYNVLQREASRAGAFEVGFTTPSAEVAETKPKFVWLLGADEVKEADIPKDAFVVYQGHHGDKGAQIADIVLPGAAYTEKAGTYINTEGRVQMTRAATSLPGASRTDWKILRAASEFLGAPLPYDDVAMVRDRMVEISPALAAYDVVEPVALPALSKVQLVDQNKGAQVTGTPLKKVIDNFYFTDVISRSSPTMARCSASKATGDARTNFMAPGMEEDKPMGQVEYGLPRRPSAVDSLQDVPDPEGYPIIPEIVSFSPAIFCPIGENDELKDTLGPASFTKLDRLQAELEALSAHGVGTRDNFLDLCVRERERIFQEGRRFEAADKKANNVVPDIQRGLSTQELESMIDNMEAPPQRSGLSSLGTTPVPPAGFDISKARSLRERQAFLHMQFIVASAMTAEQRELELGWRRAELERQIKQEQSRRDQERGAH